MFFAEATVSYLLWQARVKIPSILIALLNTTVTSILVIWLFTSAIGFIICTTVVESGQSLRTYELCYSAIIICLVFYTGNKLAM